MVKNSNQKATHISNFVDIPKIIDVIKSAESVGSDFITDDFIKSISGRNEKDTYKNL